MNKLLFNLLGIKQNLQTFGEWLVTFGPFGLFAISLIDSAGLPLPGGPDAVMILLSAKNHALVPLYAIAASAGSTIGCTIMYWIARRAGLIAFPETAGEVIKQHGWKVLLVVVIAATLLIVVNILRSRRARSLAVGELQPPIE